MRLGDTGHSLPEWVKPDVVFGVDGKVYRVVGHVGTTNRRTSGNYHFEPFVHVQLVDESPWEGLPDAPCSKADVGASLATLFAMPMFYVEHFARALRREGAA